MTLTDEAVARAFALDRLDTHSPRIVVPDEARELKAHLIVRTAKEMHQPERYVGNMAHFARDVTALSGWYWCPPEKVAAVVRAAARNLVDAWVREAAA